MDLKESVDGIIESEEILGETFYEVFLQGYPEVQRFFQGVNLQRQAVMLTMALLVIEQCRTRSPAVKEYLNDLGRKHARLGIPMDLYPQFKAALLATLKARHGDTWSDRLERQWSEAIERAIEQMLEGYPA